MGLFKRGQVWWMSLTYDGKHYRRSTETENRKLAQRIFDKVKGEIAEGKWFERLPGEDKTLQDMMEKYLVEHASKKAAFGRFKTCAKNLTASMGDLTLTKVTPKVINAYKTKRAESGVKPATINRELACLSKAFSLAVKEWEWLNGNPVSRVSREKENNKRDRWLTHEEEEKLIKVSPNWLRELIVFALNTGMRMGEIISLTWEAVDLNRKTVTVVKSKNDERRTIPINEIVLELLKARSKVRLIKPDLVFFSQTNELYKNYNIGRAFTYVGRKAGIKDFTFHDLRHTFATRLVQSGVDLYRVSNLLGHKSLSMTQRYSHHCPDSLRGAVDILGRFTILSQSGDCETSSNS